MSKKKTKSENTAQIIVSGRVQGVGFRLFCKQLAEDLMINGWVKNLNDGTVEINAHSDDNSAVKEFISKIKEGNELSTVDNIRVEWIETELRDDFQIR